MHENILSCLRPCHVENTGSRLITEVKQQWAKILLAWVTAWEYLMLYALCSKSYKQIIQSHCQPITNGLVIIQTALNNYNIVPLVGKVVRGRELVAETGHQMAIATFPNWLNVFLDLSKKELFQNMINNFLLNC